MSLPSCRKLYPQVLTIFGETQGLCYDMCRLYIVFTWNTGRRKIARALIDTRVESLKKLKLVSSRFSNHSQHLKYWTNICYSHLLSMKKDRDAPIKRRAVVKCELKMAGHSFHVGPHLSPTLLPHTSPHNIVFVFIFVFFGPHISLPWRAFAFLYQTRVRSFPGRVID